MRIRALDSFGLPLWSKQMIGYLRSYVPEKALYGHAYQSMFEFLAASELWDRARMMEYQQIRISSLLRHAQSSVPWYSRRFADYGVNASQFKDLSDLRRFPFVTKKDLQSSGLEFVSTAVPRESLVYLTTGGSTGVPVGFYQSRNFQMYELAFNAYYWRWFGIRPNDLCVELRGSYVGSHDRPFKYVTRSNHWLFSTYYLTEETFPIYLAKLNAIRPKYLQAYPSAASLFAKFLNNSNHTLVFKPRVIFCASEVLDPSQVSMIEHAFQCPVHSQYGQTERVCLAAWTPTSMLYHCFPQYGHVELLNSDDKEVDVRGSVGEIVGTSLNNFAAPLIRYRTGDVARNPDHSTEEKSYRLFSTIEGRRQDHIISSNGRRVSIAALNMHTDLYDQVLQYQFKQDAPGKVLLLVVPRNDFTIKSMDRIRSAINEKLGPDFSLALESVARIALTDRGKTRFLIQEIADVNEGVDHA